VILSATPAEGTVGAAENTSRPYRGHCRGGQETAPTEALEPPQQLTSTVVVVTLGFREGIRNKRFEWSFAFP